jgi:hypothetical protein
LHACYLWFWPVQARAFTARICARLPAQPVPSAHPQNQPCLAHMVSPSPSPRS